MKLSEFKKRMKKKIFTSTEAHIVAFSQAPELLNLQLHTWRKRGELVQLKRGVFMFSDNKCESSEIARHLCWPSYFSLEYVLSANGILPEAVFTFTLVTPKKTREFKTPFGIFSYYTIKKEAFTGFDAKTLMAEPEKALVDYFYLKSSRLFPREDFWEESRLDGSALDFEKVFRFAALFKSKKLTSLLSSFQKYAKSHSTH